MTRTTLTALACLLSIIAPLASAQEEASPESKALNHSRFVASSAQVCRQACAARSGPFTGQDDLAADCERTCACVTDQLSSRISGDDLWAMAKAERDGASRAETMQPFVPTIAMGYKACGFKLP